MNKDCPCTICNYIHIYVTIYIKRDLFLSRCSTLIIYAGRFKDEKAPLCSRDIQGTGENLAFVSCEEFEHSFNTC